MHLFYFFWHNQHNTITISTNKNTITSDNYTVSFKNNIKVGTATITIKGKNNCTGQITKNFNIVKRNLELFVTLKYHS